jgi:Domain of unknown function DUF29
MSKKNERALLSHLIILMLHIIKWYTQPWFRCKSWFDSIVHARSEIDRLLHDHPSLKRLIDGLLPKAFAEAKKKAEKEMKINTKLDEVSKKQLFDDTYNLEE